MEKVSFAFNKEHWDSPPPKKIARRIDMWSAIFGVLTVAANSAPFMSASMASTASWFLGSGTALLQGIKPFYAVSTTEKKVDIDKVDVIETEETKD